MEYLLLSMYKVKRELFENRTGWFLNYQQIFFYFLGIFFIRILNGFSEPTCFLLEDLCHHEDKRILLDSQ